jgi:hypothetical protein
MVARAGNPTNGGCVSRDVGTFGRRPLALLIGTAILSASGCGAGDSRPSSGPPLTPPTTATSPQTHRVGAPTTLPWWSAGRLRLGGRTIPTPLHEIVSRGGTTLVGRTTQHRSTWRLVRGTRLVTLISTREPYVEPVVSANGRHLAWVRSHAIRPFDRYTTEVVFTVHAYDVARGRQVGTTSVESRVRCCDAGGVYEVAGVDNDGTVLLDRLYTSLLVWRPGQVSVRATGALHPRAVTGNDQWPGGVSWLATEDGAGPAAFGATDAAGVTVRVGRVPQGPGGLWGPDGTAYVYQPYTKAPDGPPPAVVWRDGRRVRLHAPSRASVLGWESARSVILSAGRRSTVLIRCEASTGRCEQAGAPLRHPVLPTREG